MVLAPLDGLARIALCGLSQIFHEAGELPMFLAGWSGFRLNPSRTKPIDRDQRRLPGVTSERSFCSTENFTPEKGKIMPQRKILVYKNGRY
jgi:hypothetical protein